MISKGQQTTMQKTKDRATRTPLKPVVHISAPEGKAVPAQHVVLLVLLCYPGIRYKKQIFTSFRFDLLNCVAGSDKSVF
jgi:hypothetical protein